MNTTLVSLSGIIITPMVLIGVASIIIRLESSLRRLKCNM